VRHIFTLDGSKKVSNLYQLEEGESYVCASTDVFKKLDYIKSENPNWNVNAKPKDDPLAASFGLIGDSKDYIKPKLNRHTYKGCVQFIIPIAFRQCILRD
jgi:doublecortin-like kinase 1/2